MSLIYLMVVLVTVGVFLWVINAYIPMDGKIKTILNVAVVIIVIFWLLSVLIPGLFNTVGGIKVPVRR